MLRELLFSPLVKQNFQELIVWLFQELLIMIVCLPKLVSFTVKVLLKTFMAIFDTALANLSFQAPENGALIISPILEQLKLRQTVLLQRTV
jgi:hypothetical protein